MALVLNSTLSVTWTMGHSQQIVPHVTITLVQCAY